MISHDAFLVLCALIELGGEATKKQLTIAVENHVDKLVIDSCLEELIFACHICLYISLYKLINTKLISTYKNTNKIEAYIPQKNVQSMLAKTVRMSNPNYRAVVDGKRARYSPLHRYAEKHLSRQDVGKFWQEVMEMSEDERRDFNAKITRVVARSS